MWNHNGLTKAHCVLHPKGSLVRGALKVKLLTGKQCKITSSYCSYSSDFPLSLLQNGNPTYRKHVFLLWILFTWLQFLLHIQLQICKEGRTGCESYSKRSNLCARSIRLFTVAVSAIRGRHPCTVCTEWNLSLANRNWNVCPKDQRFTLQKTNIRGQDNQLVFPGHVQNWVLYLTQAQISSFALYKLPWRHRLCEYRRGE